MADRNIIGDQRPFHVSCHFIIIPDMGVNKSEERRNPSLGDRVWGLLGLLNKGIDGRAAELSEVI
jgi:hypothetical protein